MKMINIAIIDDQTLIREALAIIMNSLEHVEVVAFGKDGVEAIEICRTKPIDVLLMDVRMPGMDGLEATQKIKKEFPHLKVLILTTFADDSYLRDAILHGASGYLLKDSSPESISSAIKAVHSGTIVFDSNLTKQFLSPLLEVPVRSDWNEVTLSSKEQRILRFLAKGYSNKEIAATLFLSEGTIKNNISVILSKCQLRDRTQLALHARFLLTKHD